MKFSWKNLLGILLIVAGTVVGITVNVPVAVIGSIVAIVVGATLGIAEEMKKTTLTGWKKYLFLITIIGGTVLLALGGYSDAVVMEIVGAVILVASIIFGALVDGKKKEAKK